MACGSADLLWGWISFPFSVQKMQQLPSFWASSQLLCRVLDYPQLSHRWAACLRQFLLVLSLHSALFRSVEWGGSGGASRVIGYDPRLFPLQKQHHVGFWRQTGWDQILALPLTGCVSSDFLICKIEILISTSRIAGGINKTGWTVPGPEKAVSKDAFLSQLPSFFVTRISYSKLPLRYKYVQ